ncbi:hypothetical protein ABAZ39_23645 (plasmid) [Azospirillum argentinense]|uniref:Uncharacterized protein n=1 Tax=Azospirillum argentinense TaxID=2970906 RepID=A0A060DVG2_9PROT|nr:hypothetical protein [Azospirillum argentinense]AIB14889.1 hypothetical protein ABAZ39_23645 [Azospirillum argentinense]EZQ04641.1 hypothetical protein ABAZ39_25925 [Azospirillum argentinense]
MAKDDGSFRLVIACSLGGVAVSVALGSLLLSRWTPRTENTVVERAIHNMDRETCERVLHSFTQPQPVGTRVLWLWAEESTPGVFTGAPWTSRVTGPGVQTAAAGAGAGAGAGTGGTSAGRSPRPYAFDPASQVAPDAACSFPNNSLHIVSVEYPPKPDAAPATGKP